MSAPWFRVTVHDSDVGVLEYRPIGPGSGVAYAGVAARTYFEDESIPATDKAEKSLDSFIGSILRMNRSPQRTRPRSPWTPSLVRSGATLAPNSWGLAGGFTCRGGRGGGGPTRRGLARPFLCGVGDAPPPVACRFSGSWAPVEFAGPQPLEVSATKDRGQRATTPQTPP